MEKATATIEPISGRLCVAATIHVTSRELDRSNDPDESYDSSIVQVVDEGGTQ